MATRTDLNVRDLLSTHLLRLLRKYRIRTEADLSRLRRIQSAETLQPIQAAIERLPSISEVEFRWSPHSLASSFFKVLFRGTALGGMSIEVSHIAPVFCWKFVPPEGLKPLDWSMSREKLMCIIDDYDKAIRRKVPAKAESLAAMVLESVTAYGLMEIPDSEMERKPVHQARLPKPLQKYCLGFFFFDAIPLFDPVSHTSRKRRRSRP